MERKHIQFGDDPSIEFAIHEDGTLHVELSNDWYGDTESGFGATLCETMTREQVAELREFLKAYDPTPETEAR